MENFQAIQKYLEEQSEDLLLVLRAHLLIEQSFEQIILENTDIKLQSNERFSTKLLIVQALNILPSQIVDSIRKLNYLRNKFSHTVGYKITKTDIKNIQDPLKNFDIKGKDLKATIYFISGFLLGVRKEKKGSP